MNYTNLSVAERLIDYNRLRKREEKKVQRAYTINKKEYVSMHVDAREFSRQ